MILKDGSGFALVIASVLLNRDGLSGSLLGQAFVMDWDYIQTTYDEAAGKYEDQILNELDRKPADREMLETFASSTSDPVFEIGCGPGQVGLFVRDLDHSVIGVDLSFGMAKHAGNGLTAALVADMRQVPIKGAAAGGLLAFYSLIHVKRDEMPTVLHEFNRALRMGGHILLAAHEGEGELHTEEFLDLRLPIAATLFGLEALVDTCEKSGFSVLMTRRRSPYEGEHTTMRIYVEAAKAAGHL